MSRDRKLVLVIDDSAVIHRLVEARLRADGFEVVSSKTGADGLRMAREQKPDVILLDVDMPDINGHEACRQLKSDSATMFIPVIFLTAQASTNEKVKGLDLGAVDYITKPFDPVELRARVRSAYRTKYLVELLEQKAQIDGLTGLYNRAHLDERVEQEFERARRYGADLAVLMIDVDRFKQLNDTYGHSFGDQVLAEIAEILRSQVRDGDVVARYGGEEFAVILPEQDLAKAAVLADRLRQCVAKREFEHNLSLIRITISLGVASSTSDAFASASGLLDAADRALYAAKNGGRNAVYCWSRESGATAYASPVASPDPSIASE